AIDNIQKIATIVGRWLGLVKDQEAQQAEQQKKEFVKQKKEIDTEQAKRADLYSLVERNGADAAAKMQRVINAVNAKRQGQAARLEQQLKRFNELHHKNLQAIKNGDRVVEHELNDEIHTTIADFNRETQERHGEIIKGWYDALPDRFINMPEPGQDSEYDAVQQEAAELAQQTIRTANSIEYPRLPGHPS
ncbi:MAG TPA: hypothetical protein VEF90_06815, partial [Xanthobacteraceae bacterium]|nr:hypothetical protein [Xanthobacteraceae bacterium]